MIFASMQDSHDRSVEKMGEVTDSELTNMNLVGIRRRLNNIEVGIWMLVALAVIDAFRG